MGKILRCAGLAGLMLAVMAGLSPAQAQVRAIQLMKIEGPVVNGESQVVDHRNWIEVSSFGQEVQHPLGSSPDTGYLYVLKGLDRASVLLAFHAVSGTAFDLVTLESLSLFNEEYAVDYRVELWSPRITLIRPELGGSARQESVAFDGYTQIKWTYYYRRPDGSIISTVTRTVPGS